MNETFELSVDVSKPYNFRRDELWVIENNTWVQNKWPLVYFIQNAKQRIAYIGETTDAINRFKTHFQNKERLKLNSISIISSDKFNKSVTLDIEANLIQYLSGEGNYILQNANTGQ